MKHAAWLAAAIWLAAAPSGAEPPADDPYEVGIRRLDQGEWAEALPIYRTITLDNPAYPWGWMGLGWSLHYTGDYRGALPAYRRALELGALQPSRVWLEIARCQAALGARDSAYAALEAALAAGLTNLGRLAGDSRLDLVRREPRFRDLMGLPDSTLTDRVAAWRRDLALLSREVKRVHVSPFRLMTEKEFDRAIAAIADSVPRLDDDGVAVRVMRVVCRLGDGHTDAEPAFMQEGAEESVPVLFGRFDDGLFVTATRPGHEDLLWAEVLEVEGLPAAQALAAMDPVVPKDNPMRLLSVGPQRLRYPRLLRALGVARSARALGLRVRDRKGRVRSVTLEVASRGGEWVREPAAGTGRLPGHARRRADWYWFEMLPDRGTLYVQYNACADKDSESVEGFSRRLRDFVDGHDVRRMVVDLRHNGGGNLRLNRPLLEAIVQSRKVNQPGKLFVIAGRHTFSAAMSFAAQLERYTHAVFAGEPTGSSPNFVGETNFMTLPHSRMLVSLSNLAWQNSFAQDHRVWIAPRIPVPWNFADYREGRDPALEAILRFGS